MVLLFYFVQGPRPSQLANVFCSYGGLVDVLEVRAALTAAGNKLRYPRI